MSCGPELLTCSRCAGPPSTRRPASRGFTLIELLVVIAIISVLLGLLMPAVQQARDAARRTQCKSHLRQLGIALHSYHDVHNTLPPGDIVFGPAFRVQSGWGWGAFLLPYLEQSPLYNQLDFNTWNADGANLVHIAQPLPIYVCPTDAAPSHITVPLPGTGGASVAHANYCGSGSLFFELSATRFAHVSDGLSQTWMVGERRYLSSDVGESTSAWCGTLACPAGYLHYSSVPYLLVLPGTSVNSTASFNSLHPGGTQFLLGDGAVQFVSESLDRHVYFALSTPNGGEVVDLPF